MDVNKHERLSNITYIQIKIKKQLVVRKDIRCKDVNQHERISKFKETLATILTKKIICFGNW